MKNRAQSQLVSAKYNNEQLPRRIDYPAEISSRSAIFLVHKAFVKINDTIETMKKLCPLSEVAPFFTAYSQYKIQISNLLDQSNMILRKLAPQFAYSTYNISEDLRQSHQMFLMALSHLNLKKQGIYYRNITELLHKLIIDFESFMVKYKGVAQIKQVLNNFANIFRKKIDKIEADIRTILLPIEFENLDFDFIVELVERLRHVNRLFEVELYNQIKQKAPKLQLPLSGNTEWHDTFITIVPLLSNMPLFIEQTTNLGEMIPDMTSSLELLCNEIDDLLPSRDEDRPFNPTTTTSFEPDPVEGILERAQNFFNVDVTDKKSKITKLETVMEHAENTVSSLRQELDQEKTKFHQLELQSSRKSLSEKFSQARKATDEIAKRYENEKNMFLDEINHKLSSLVKAEDLIRYDNPYHQFNAIFLQLSKEMRQLKEQVESSNTNSGTLNKMQQILQKVNPELEQNEINKLTIDEMVTQVNDSLKIDAGSRMDSFLIQVCTKYSGSSHPYMNLTTEELMAKINIIISESREFKNAMINICAQLTNKDKKSLERKSPQELSDKIMKKIKKMLEEAQDTNLINIDEIMQLIPVKSKEKVGETVLNELEAAKYTKVIVDPINALISELCSILDDHCSAYLPTSQHFTEFLDALSSMKQKLQRVDTSKIQQPIHSLLVKSVELFNSLAIALSSASFAPEYSPNQKEIAEILVKQQTLSQSIERLRLLLEEKETLLHQETNKLRKAEKQIRQLTSQ